MISVHGHERVGVTSRGTKGQLNPPLWLRFNSPKSKNNPRWFRYESPTVMVFQINSFVGWAVSIQISNPSGPRVHNTDKV